ncbi:unnamed protein product [Clonostachys solani]|uniref:WD repeat-containing protein n=1 Tax=Clonostachys solani TaxID=160281 RepID=A0A9P0EF15_9HYPO|nr:unnamed protein product [Clonostachys solani]
MRSTPPLLAHRLMAAGASSHHIGNTPQVNPGTSSTSFSAHDGADSMSISEDQDDGIPDLDLASHGFSQDSGVSNLPEDHIFHHTPMAQDPNPSSSLQGISGNYFNVVDQADGSSASSGVVSNSPSSIWLDDDIMSEGESNINEGGNSLYPSHIGSFFNSLQPIHSNSSSEVDMEEVDIDGPNGSDPDFTDEDEAAPHPSPPPGPHNNTFGFPLGYPGVNGLAIVPTTYSLNPLGYAYSFPNAPPLAPGEDDLPPLMLSSGSAETTGSQNYGLLDFLRYWARYGSFHRRQNPNFTVPNTHRMMDQISRSVRGVSYSDLNGDNCDMQGLDWESMGVTRKTARITRNQSYKNYVNIPGSDTITTTESDTFIPPSESYFRYRQTIMRSDVHLSHFQLRSVLACPSRSQVYYATRRGINRLNPVSKRSDLVMNVRSHGASQRTVTALDATSEVLVGGTFNGDYCIKPIHAEDTQRPSEGQITGDSGSITTHIQIHTPRRSSSPVAAIASNDNGLRMLDLTTEQFISETFYPSALNCSAISPDRRLRVLVGDTPDTSIVNADTGAVEVTLKGHRDYGFSCDWSDDGVTVATGFQDRRVKIWDARKWADSSGNSTPVMSILCELSSARSLKFSPLGSGEPVLVAAEEADYINIIDGKTFRKKQTIDLFGEIGGVAFAEEGQQLNVLVSDTRRGGLIQFDRCGLLQSSRFTYPLSTLRHF